MSNIAAVLEELEVVRKAVRAVDNKQIFSAALRNQIHSLAARYFDRVRGDLPNGADAQHANDLFSELHELSRKTPSTQKCLSVLTEARRALVKLEGASMSQPGTPVRALSAADDLIIAKLRKVHAPAADAYAQALRDLSGDRLSWRGPATDFREALREILDVLAPDSEVEKIPNFKLEQGTQRPTMKQKTK